MLESIQLNGEALSSGQVRDNQATLRKAKREAARAPKSRPCKKVKTQEPSGQAPEASAEPPKAKGAPSEKRLQEERKARAGMDKLLASWENMPDCRPKKDFDPASFKNLSLV